MACPPGKILNPRTLRCVKATGRKAHTLVAQGDIADYYAQAPIYAARKTARRSRVAAAFGAAAPEAVCPPGQERNPTTGRCIKTGGKTYKRLHPSTTVVAAAAEVRRKTSSEGPTRLPVGSAGVAPLADRPTILGWASAQCKNDRDPISGIQFASADAVSLQDLIRLHNRTCVMSGPLNAKVTAEHKAGQVATIPGETTHMTLDDFTALRDSMRRHNPGYKIPARKHQPPPPNWQLYIASDNRSGPEFVSVLIIDVTQVVQGPAGPEYPVDSVMMDLGFIPIHITGGLCAPQMVVDLIQRLAAANRLLIPVAGGWKPVAGFPFTKKYWSGPDARERFGRLCRELTKALATPL